MARIAGVDLPRKKHIRIALTYIYGIGRPTSLALLSDAQIDKDKRVKDARGSRIIGVGKEC